MTGSRRQDHPDGPVGAWLAHCLLLGVAVLTAGLMMTGARLDHGVTLTAAGAVLAVLAAGAWGWAGRRGSRQARQVRRGVPSGPRQVVVRSGTTVRGTPEG